MECGRSGPALSHNSIFLQLVQEKLIEDQWYFVLATLLSSTLVYNHQGNLDADGIKKLKYPFGWQN